MIAMPIETKTSRGVWTPRYILEKATKAIVTRQAIFTHLLPLVTAIAPNVPAVF